MILGIIVGQVNVLVYFFEMRI